MYTGNCCREAKIIVSYTTAKQMAVFIAESGKTDSRHDQHCRRFCEDYVAVVMMLLDAFCPYNEAQVLSLIQ